jgi:hypothetical protein
LTYLQSYRSFQTLQLTEQIETIGSLVVCPMCDAHTTGGLAPLSAFRTNSSCSAGLTLPQHPRDRAVQAEYERGVLVAEVSSPYIVFLAAYEGAIGCTIDDIALGWLGRRTLHEAVETWLQTMRRWGVLTSTGEELPQRRSQWTARLLERT